MKCYMQNYAECGYAYPQPDEYDEFDSIKEAMDAFDDWADEVGRVYDRKEATAQLFLGEAEGMFPCDTIPDYTLSIGPRDGIRRTRN